MKIDLHTHILPENWPDFTARYAAPGWVSIVHHAPCRARMMIGRNFFREITHQCWDPAVRISDCDRSGVDLQVLSTLPVMFSYWAKPEHALDLSRMLNDHIAQVVADHPARFVGLGTLPLQSPDLAIRELERCVLPPQRGGLALAGVQIGSHVNDWNLDAPELFPVFQRAAQLGAAVFVHPWDMMGKDRMPRFFLPWLVGMPAETSLAICSMIFGGVFERLPNLRVAFAHGGGSFPGTIGRIDHGFHARPDLCAAVNDKSPRTYLAQPDGTPARFYVDSLVHDSPTLESLITLFGPERIALGSDYPFPLGESEPGRLIESLPNITPYMRDRMLGATAAEFLALADAPPRPNS